MNLSTCEVSSHYRRGVWCASPLVANIAVEPGNRWTWERCAAPCPPHRLHIPILSNSSPGTAGRSTTGAASTSATGATAADVAAQREVCRRSLAFYYSTPPYWPPLQLFGWEELGPKLREMTFENKWDAMGSLISDEMVDTLVPQASYDDLPDVLIEWYGTAPYSMSVPVPDDPRLDGEVSKVIARLQAA